MASTVRVKTKPIRYPRKATIRAGILEPGDEHEGGLTVGELATIHEYGLGAVPARAPIRTTFDLGGKDFQKIAKQQFELAAKQGSIASFRRAAGLLAEKAAAGIKNTISFGNLEPLAESTVERKIKRGLVPPFTPLVETGVLRNHYTGDSKVTP